MRAWTHTPHQYVERATAAVRTERLLGDGCLRLLYRGGAERPGPLLRLLTSARASALLGMLNYDLPFGFGAAGRFARSLGVDLAECVGAAGGLNTPRKVFERQIRYWDVRPMDDDPSVLVAPADSRMLIGSLADPSPLRVKGMFFDLEELLSVDRRDWIRAFRGGDFAIFRLTPDKYHYSHAPVTGRVVDLYEIAGAYHSCNPAATVALATPHSKNRRVVTIIDTDVPGGTGTGLVAMIEVVALMIGDVVQCYSDHRYDQPRDVRPGLLVRKGQPKSRYRPGSSTDVLLLQPGRVLFADDIIRNTYRQDVQSRYSQGFGRPLVETELAVRSTIGIPRDHDGASRPGGFGHEQ